jgi:dihydroorotate dehydrogenase (NAD+) catalytic subunit
MPPMPASELPRYNPLATYAENFDAAPDAVPAIDVPPVPGEWTFCGLPVNSPLGIAAGPLLNGRWIRYYAALGFDILTYKTVRSGPRDCYPLPNLVPVDVSRMSGDEEAVPATDDWQGSWAVSFGMPSQSPEFWKEDIRRVKSQLGPGQVLSVSVVGTIQPDWTIDELADDYAWCAREALASGADAIEMNFSCPNVCSRDGQLYQEPETALTVASRVRGQLTPETPLLVKVGYLDQDDQALRLLHALSGVVDAVVATNSVSAKVRDGQGQPLFDGQPRGICGRSIREASVGLVRRFSEIIERDRLPLQLVGVGGIETAPDVEEYLAAGAESVQLATAVMRDPLVGIRIRQTGLKPVENRS